MVTQTSPATTPILYVDMVPQTVTVTVFAGTPAHSANTLCLGRAGDYNGNYLVGMMGETRIYSRACTPTEGLSNYQATKWRYQ